LKSKRRLSELLHIDLRSLLLLADARDNYQIFTIYKNGKPRKVETPKKQLEAIHTRLFKLLQRIETPDYLHSGVKQRSHVTNAKAHENSAGLVKLDIKSYYPSTKRERVYQFFRNDLHCSPDVAKLLSDLSCVDGHIPTGSPLSQILAFFASFHMFEGISQLANDNEIAFTVYVDDLTFSGPKVSQAFLWNVKKVIHNYGFGYHKLYSAPPQRVKVVTGVAIGNDGMRVQNKHQKAIYQLYSQHIEDEISNNDMPRLIGMMSSASQVSSKFDSKLKHLLKIQAKQNKTK
jgi:hypothetical protein